jgi:hypothetical protein
MKNKNYMYLSIMRIMQKRLYGSSKPALKLGENSKSSLFFNAPPFMLKTVIVT